MAGRVSGVSFEFEGGRRKMVQGREGRKKGEKRGRLECDL